MGLEAITGIWDFNTSWPLSTDKRRQGDDHLRGIKLGVKNTWPNITEPVTVTAEVLNSVPASLSDIITELLLHIEKPGSIKAWDLANKPIPTGWVLCDGSTVPGYGTVPDMRNRFVVASGNTFTAQTTGGDPTPEATAAGGHTPTINGTAITQAQLPNFSPRLYVWESGTNGPGQMEHFASGGIGPAQGVAGNADSNVYAYREATVGGNKLIEPLGSGQTHTHTAAAVPDHTHPLELPSWYSAVFIVKVADYEAP